VTANNIANQNGISRLQRDILLALGQHKKPVPASSILQHYVARPSAAQRVALSKSLKRLCERGLVDSYTTEVLRPGKGLLYVLRKT